MLKCPNGHENPDGLKICDECGANLEASATVATAEKPRESGGIAARPGKLIITRGGTVGKEFPLETNAETHIGRWDPDGGAFPEVDLTSDDPEAKISRKHARIFVQDGEYYIEDLGSLNGTYCNRGPRLLPGSPQILKDQDEVVMGKTFFKFAFGE
ncbi:MAG: FHA domain-containing protein [Candidatus Sericytochromatia bacterium]|nr:FHA domain-containing protein [Candidatus Tanganyikabacteria bacterium]